VVSTRAGSDQRKPAVSGKVVVWEDYRRGPNEPDIWARNLDNDSAGSVTDRVDARDPSISGFWVAYRVGDPASDNQRIRLINLATKEERAITDRVRIGSGPRISGNLVVWADLRNDEDFNVWGYDISTDKSFKVASGDKDQTAPDLSGTVAVWEDGRGDNPRDIKGARLTIPTTATSTPTASASSGSSGSGQPAPLGGPCVYQLGFATLRGMVVSTYGDIVGSCLENEWHNADNGDGLQRSSGRGGGSIGMMVWRKADNWTAFTDGYQTWLNGPCGLQVRLNTQSFSWEGRPGGSCT